MEWFASIIAVAVAVIAYFQWRTAHDRVTLDLFDRRREVYDEIVDSIFPIIAHGSVMRADADSAFLIASRKAQFLFGDDVINYLNDLWKLMNDIRLAETYMDSSGAAQKKWLEQYQSGMRHIHDFHNQFPELCAPYLRLDHKRARGVRRWLLDSFGFKKPVPQIRQPIEKSETSLTRQDRG